MSGARGRAVPLLALTWLLLGGLAAPARAHPLAPALLEIEEGDGGRVMVTWKQSRLAGPGAVPSPVLPASCSETTAPTRSFDALRVTLQFEADCGAGGLVGLRLGVSNLDRTGTDALVRVRLRDGRTFQRVLNGSAQVFEVPDRPSRLAVLHDYARLGITHILGGADHLLFVFGLLLLVGGGVALLRTVTAFTLGHSVTLGLAALGIVRLPTALIEIAIAASVFWLAVDLARGAAAKGRYDSWLRRAPWRMAALFGLLHGLGFAGALSQAGLPEGEIPLALGSFNVGIEAGQLAFLAAVVALGWLALRAQARLRFVMPEWLGRAPVYVMGSLAALWCIERAVLLLS